MKRFVIAATLWVAAFVSLVPDAAAGQVFQFSFTNSTVSITGTLTSNPNGDGTFTAVSGTAHVAGAPVNGDPAFVANPNAPGSTVYSSLGSSYGVYDDLLRPGSSPLITDGGLLFQFPSGLFVNIFSSGASSYIAQEITATRSIVYRNSGSFTLTAVPEPSSLVMMGMASTLGLGYVARRHRRATAASHGS